MKTIHSFRIPFVHYLIPLASLLQAGLANGVILHFEDFETDGEGMRYVSNAFTDSANDYFIRTDGKMGASGIPLYSDYGGSFFWAAEDVDGPGNPDGIAFLEIPDINISGIPQVQITLAAAAGALTVFDSLGDHLFVSYRVDGGGWLPALAFKNDGARYNTALYQDIDFDGIGDGQPLTLAFRNFSSALLDISGTQLDLRLDVMVDANLEELAFDNITVVAVPEPSTYATVFGFLAVAVLGLQRFCSPRRGTAFKRA